MGAGSGLVSVVIPTYNRAELCAAAIRSVLNQTYGRLEVIVVDDGSTDDTEAVVRRFGEPVRYVRQERGWVAAAINRGLDLAGGEFIAFLASDDTWLPWKVEAQVETLRRFPEVGMVWTDGYAVDPDGRITRPSLLRRFSPAWRYFSCDEMFERSIPCGAIWPDCPSTLASRRCYMGDIFSPMFMGNLFHISTLLLRHDVQRAVGYFDVTFVGSEDWDFHLRTCRQAKGAFLDVSAIRCQWGAADRVVRDELCHWIARDQLTATLRTLERDGERLQLPPSLVRRRLAGSWRWVGTTHLTIDRKKARAALRTSLGLRPFDAKTVGGYLLSFLPPVILERVKRSLKRGQKLAYDYSDRISMSKVNGFSPMRDRKLSVAVHRSGRPSGDSHEVTPVDASHQAS